METSEKQDLRPWMQSLLKQCGDLLCCADGLLSQYAGKRRRPGWGLSPLCKVLDQLRLFTAGLSREDQRQLLPWQIALEERLVLLRQRRIPSTSLRRFRGQCRCLWRHLMQLQGSETCFLDSQIPWETPDVLVGTLRRPSQLEICLIHGFYHVPVCQIPRERLPIRYVAIYQSRALFPEDCGIRFYGAVKRCTPVRRWEISEIPKSSEEWYYRIEVERWEQLDEPIAVREVPFTHLFTNVFLLTHSRETPQLYLKSEWEYRCYQALNAAIQKGSGIALRHCGGRVQLKKGRLRVYKGFRPVAAYEAEDFCRTPSAVFTSIMNCLEKT